MKLKHKIKNPHLSEKLGRRYGREITRFDRRTIQKATIAARWAQAMAY